MFTDLCFSSKTREAEIQIFIEGVFSDLQGIFPNGTKS